MGYRTQMPTSLNSSERLTLYRNLEYLKIKVFLFYIELCVSFICIFSWFSFIALKNSYYPLFFSFYVSVSGMIF